MAGSNSQRGFTLMELMIAVVVVAILAAIAIPSYEAMLRRSNRNLVRATLQDLAAKQEQQRLRTRCYATTFAPLIDIGGATAYLNKDGTLAAASGPETVYTIEFSDDPAPTCNSYEFDAGTSGNQTRDKDCADFTISSTGRREAGDADDGDATQACWG